MQKIYLTQGYLKHIDGAASRLLGIINDISNFSKIEEGWITRALWPPWKLF